MQELDRLRELATGKLATGDAVGAAGVVLAAVDQLRNGLGILAGLLDQIPGQLANLGRMTDAEIFIACWHELERRK
jgi:hypothetical protein